MLIYGYRRKNLLKVEILMSFNITWAGKPFYLLKVEILMSFNLSYMTDFTNLLKVEILMSFNIRRGRTDATIY